MGYIIEVKDVTEFYHGKRRKSLNGVSFFVEEGEFVLLSGEQISCAALINILAGIERPSSGKVLFYGENLLGLTDNELSEYRRRYVGLFSGSHLIANLTALQNITLSGSEKEGIRLMSEMGLRDKLNAFPSELSLIEIKLVSLIRAVARSPALLLISDPTSGLIGEKRVMVEAIRSLRGDMTAIISSSDRELLTVADRVITLTKQN